MTLTWDEVTYAFDVINYDWEGNELVFSGTPTVFLDAEGSLAALTGTGRLAAFAATNSLLAFTKSGLLASLAATGTLNVSFAAPPGSLLTYTATGVIEDGD